MSQITFWKQLITTTRNWKVIQVGLKHIEKAAAETTALRTPHLNK